MVVVVIVVWVVFYVICFWCGKKGMDFFFIKYNFCYLNLGDEFDVFGISLICMIEIIGCYIV